MKPYEDGRYLFPPRPATKSPTSGLVTFERMGFIAQPKLNGSCGVSIISPSSVKMMNRHNESFANQIVTKEDLMRLQRGTKYNVLCGEYMNKSKKDGNGKLFNACFVIFDILVHNGQYLLDSTVLERQELLEDLYPTTPFDKYIGKVSNNIFRVNNFKTNLLSTYNDITKIDMYEGWVLKKPNGILETGYSANNNVGWQVKVRKPTKNYSH